MDVSQIVRANVSTSVAKIVAGKEEPHHPNYDRRVVIFALRGAVRFAGSERFTRAIVRELGEPDPKDPGSGEHRDACAIGFAPGRIFSQSRCPAGYPREYKTFARGVKNCRGD
jgi:glutaminase